MKLKRFTIFMVSLVMMIPLVTSTYANAEDNNTTAKISEELKLIMEESKDEQLIPIYVWLKDINHEDLYEEIKNETGYDVDLYENNTSKVVKEIVEDTQNKYGNIKSHLRVWRDIDTNELKFGFDAYISPENIISEDEIIERFSMEELEELADAHSGNSLVSTAISEAVDNYIAVKRSYLKKAYIENNNTIINKYGIENSNIISIAFFAPFIIMEVDKNTINLISLDELVIKIDYYNEQIIEEDEDTGGIHTLPLPEGDYLKQYTVDYLFSDDDFSYYFNKKISNKKVISIDGIEYSFREIADYQILPNDKIVEIAESYGLLKFSLDEISNAPNASFTDETSLSKLSEIKSHLMGQEANDINDKVDVFDYALLKRARRELILDTTVVLNAYGLPVPEGSEYLFSDENFNYYSANYDSNVKLVIINNNQFIMREIIDNKTLSVSEMIELNLYDFKEPK